MRAPTDFDCAIIGAGLAGSAAAAVAGRAGHHVLLVDPRATCRPTFKAEKIEPDQVASLRRLDLAQGVLPLAARIHGIHEAHRGRVLRTVPIEQYGLSYHSLVNAVRAQVPRAVKQRIARVTRVESTPDRQAITLDTGEALTARLVVNAAGTTGQTHRALRIERREIRARHSVSIGFDIARADRRPFPFDALTYWADSLNVGLDFVTLFRVPDRMRVNIFAYADRRDPLLLQLAEQPGPVLAGLTPGLTPLIGDWVVSSRIQSQVVDLYRIAPPSHDGLVVIGDALQSVCPATGTGLTKVLTDVEVLCRTWLPRWLETPGMRVEKLAPFYADARKLAADEASLASAEYRRRFSTDRSWRWRLHRRKSYLQMRWSRPATLSAPLGRR